MTKGKQTVINDISREKKIYRVTLWGSLVNMLLVAIKFVFGIVGCSAAMIADAVHSLSDLVTDAVVIVFVKLSNKPQDEDHDYGHGKYETLATSIVGLSLLFVGVLILYNGVDKIYAAIQGETLQQPGIVALFAAVVSIMLKEWTYQFTVSVGKKVNSQAVIANAWHHRSDALSSIGTAIGISGAIFLSDKWVVLDPIAAVIVSLFIMRTAWLLMKQASDELLEKSLPKDIEQEIISIVEEEEGVTGIHNLRTRRIGSL
ncbi:MAG: cation diffusion facilitator family transporter, partial [Bacteroidales bacterium]|nr:cation diffusion facilitator family transporter [Bacteroidales bacterium]